MRALGLGDALDRFGTAAQGVVLRHGLTDRAVLRLDVAGRGFHFLHRADLVALLAQGAREAGVQIRLLHRIASVDLGGPRARVTTTTGTQIESDLLIGADGLQSRLRAALNGPETPGFTGQVAWRALLPCEPGAAALAEVHMGPGRHLVSYPLRGGTLRNIVAVEERAQWAEESWSVTDDPAHLRAAFAGFSPRVRGWLDAVSDVHLWGLYRHPVARHWHGPQAALLGDAAHPTLPFLAQGANMALEDAWVLASALASHDTPAAAFAAYQQARAARCTRIVTAAANSARLYHLHSPQRQIAHIGLRIGGKIAPHLPLSRFDWLYRHDVTALPV